MLKNRSGRRHGLVMFWSFALAGLMTGPAANDAGAQSGAHVSQRTIERPYWVSGSTAGQLVDFMRRYPIRGEKGPQLANIRPRYTLDVVTRPGRGCTLASVNLQIEFTMTLPRGRQESAMDHRARRLWKSFTGFARKHELKHRRIYLGCARTFAASTGNTPKAANCAELNLRLRQQMNSAMQACKVQHRALDRGDFARLKRQPLLRAANVRLKK